MAIINIIDIAYRPHEGKGLPQAVREAASCRAWFAREAALRLTAFGAAFLILALTEMGVPRRPRAHIRRWFAPSVTPSR